MKLLLATATAALVAALPATAASQEQEKLRKSETVVNFFTGSKHGWMIARNQTYCTAVPWLATCTIARAKLKWHQGRAEKLKRQLWYSLPHTRDWMTAVRVAQRAYPGTARWLASCSASEGGHGRWVPNRDGAPPGGWMQMYSSTFWRMYGEARSDLNARGFVVPGSTASWYSPLGQALASAWGYTHGRRHEWAGSGC